MTEACIWCGHELMDDATRENVYACGSVQHPRSDAWSQSAGCEEIMRSRNRIKRAVEVLEGATRFDFVASYMPHMDKRSDGEFIEHDEAEQALEILRGNSPESPDSSPVTADQLATEDYFEAVRQRVPWMTSIEHIEDLVEGYRRCGVMVWRAAELIRLILRGCRMNQPTECEHCGLHATWHIHEDTFFACGTIYAGRGDYWNQSTGCVEIMQFLERIKRAIEVLETATRFDVIPWDGGVSRDPSDGGGEVDADVVDQAIEILKGGGQ